MRLQLYLFLQRQINFLMQDCILNRLFDYLCRNVTRLSRLIGMSFFEN
jgi:hypothetical protein